MAKYQGGKVGSLSRLREQLKKGGGGTFIKNVPANDVMVVRFLTEPDEWYQYDEAYDPEVRRYFPLLEGMERNPDMRISKRFLANVLDLSDNEKVIPLKMPKDLANRILMRYDRYDTIMDRDYELSRMGEGLDTTYDCAPGDKTPRNLKKFTLLDLDDVLIKAADYATGGSASAAKDDTPKVKAKATAARTTQIVADDDDDDDEILPVAAAKPVKAIEPDDDDIEDDDDDDEDEDEPVAPVKKAAPAKKAVVAKKPAPAPVVVDEDEDDDDEGDEAFPEDDEDDDEPETVVSTDDDDSYSEAELQAMSLRDLRALADAYDIDHGGMSKSALIEAILYE